MPVRLNLSLVLVLFAGVVIWTVAASATRSTPALATSLVVSHTTTADFAAGEGDGSLIATGTGDGALEPVRLAGPALWKDTGNDLPAALMLARAAQVGSYLFVAGGSLGILSNPNVFRARVYENETLGEWHTERQLPRPYIPTYIMVGAGKYLFVEGADGDLRANPPPHRVLFSSRVGDDGRLDAWRALPPLPPLAANGLESIHDRAAVVADGYLFIVGLAEDENGRQPAAYSATIHADGSLGDWVSVTSLPLPLEGVALVAYGHALYAIGGRVTAGAESAAVYRAPVEAEGRLGEWVRVAALPEPVIEHAAATAAGRLVVAGGSLADEAAHRTFVLSARIQPDGQLDDWSALGSIPIAMSSSPTLFAVQGQLFATGGQRTFPLLYSMSFNPTAVAGSWRSYPDDGVGADIAGAGDYLFRLGPAVDDQTPAYSRYLAPDRITVTGWLTQTVIPEVITPTSLIAGLGQLFALVPAADGTSRLFRSSIGISGTLDAWSAADAPPAARSVVIAGTWLVIRGADTLWSARVDASGSVGTWQPAGSIPVVPSGAASILAIGSDLVVCDCPGASSLSNDSLAWRAALGPDGLLTDWESLDAPFPRPVRGIELSSGRGFLFALGGLKSTGLFAAPWQWGRGPATWRLLPRLPGSAPMTSMFNGGIVLGNNVLFTMSGPPSSAAYRAPLNAAVHRGLFGHQFDLGGEFVLNRLSWQREGTSEAQVRLRYRVAPAGGVFGPWSPFTTTNPVDIPGNLVGRYVQYQLEVENPIDDFFAITQVDLLRDASFVAVRDEFGQPVSGARVYQGGTPAGRTGSDGRLEIDTLQVGDSLVALALQEEITTTKGAHQTETDGPNWAYRVFQTSLAVQPDGQVRAYMVTEPGEQVLVVHRDRALVLFNVVVSTEWDPTQYADLEPQIPFDTYLKQLQRAFTSASDYLFDATDGQMAFGQVTLYTGSRHWEDADVQVLASDQVRPATAAGGITGQRPYVYTSSASRSTAFYPGHLRIGRYWTRYSGFRGRWDEPDGYRSLVHEFAHYALYLFDEYFYVDTQGREQPGHCTSPDIATSALYQTNASIMDWQYNASELAMQGTGQWSDVCRQTVQWQVHGESDWETLVGNYADRQAAARWLFKTPTDLGGEPNPGPEYLPRELLTMPVVRVEPGDGRTLESLPLEVAGEQGVLIAGKQVQLYLFRQESGQTIQVMDEGAPDSLGKIDVLGARSGDVVKAFTWDGSASISQELSGPGRLTLRASRGWNPTIEATPVERGRALTVRVSGIPSGVAGLVTRLFQPGGAYSQTVQLAAAGDGVFSGTLHLEAGRPSLDPIKEGHLHVFATGDDGQPISDTVTTFSVGGVGPSIKESHPPIDPASIDGNLRLHIPDATGLPDDLLVIVMPTRGVPGVPSGRRVVGTPYSVRASGGVETIPPSALAMYYHGEAVEGTDEIGLRIFWWNSQAGRWEQQAGIPEPDRNRISTVITRLGIFAIMSGGDEPHRLYLPAIRRD